VSTHSTDPASIIVEDRTANTTPFGHPARPFPWLVADIGGTNARFGLITGDAPDFVRLAVRHVRTLPVAAFPGPAHAAQAYLDTLAAELGPAFRAPRAAAFAVATSVTDDMVDLVNSHWRFSRAAVQAALGLDAFIVLNDFHAWALALPHLDASQLRAHTQLPQPHGTLAVIGPGTGLGVAGVVQTPSGWIALPAEGGHATLSAADDFESALLAHARQTYPHVSAERLLSGIGMPVLYGAVAHVLGAVADNLTTEQIVSRGMDESDPVCRRTLEAFCALLGSFAGNVALTLGARGGVYISGGIVPRLGERFFASSFRERFEAKGRFRGYLEDIPTALITDTLAALTGAAAAIAQDAP
jgi:glucokinase